MKKLCLSQYVVFFHSCKSFADNLLKIGMFEILVHKSCAAYECDVDRTRNPMGSTKLRLTEMSF